ncbi:hybrid sensor histidine kinase/response regulator [Frigidibacter oleivorans]|uniref:hybrid sensor histidine kinase/response regulator n=1 Tax=Frigidibacter oleivorans TaxID=2487129 RepID=UPI000F8DD6BF|nr:PAS domain-containing hybrid sensor histidine kinase/response regulator [Frigidibacter oleivorans]
MTLLAVNPYAEAAVTARRQQRMTVISIAVLAVFTALITAYIFVILQTQLSRSEEAASDNRTWVLAQIEVDLLKYELALTAAARQPDQPDRLEAVRRQFDILYSRLSIAAAPRVSPQARLPDSAAWARLKGPGGLIESHLPLLDAGDAALGAAAARMAEDVAALRDPLRQAVLDAVTAQIAFGEVTRSELRGALGRFIAAVMWLTFGMAVLMLSIYRQGRRQAHHAQLLAIAVQNLRSTLNASLDGVVILGPSGRIVSSNDAFRDMLGGVELTGAPPMAQFISRSDVPVDQLLAGFEPGRRYRVELNCGCERTCTAELSLASVRTETERNMVVAFVHDISDQIARESYLSAARSAAEAAGAAKARFLAVMSHEMRTPLNGLLSAAELLHDTALDADQRWYAGIIRSCGNTALEQVNNVLHLTRLAAAETEEFPATVFSLPQELDALVNQFSADAARNRTSLTLAGDIGPDFAIRASLPSLRRALSNLLSNAVKFTEDGSIVLRLTRSPAEAAGHVRLTVAVEDTGIGIAAEDIDRIFQNFETLDTSYSRLREGSGLGLGIAKLSTEALGGRIEARSTLGAGSAFTLIFDAPLAALPLPVLEPMADPAEGLLDARLLLVEDNAVNRMLLRRQLEGLGVTVTEAVDGVEALEQVARAPFDLVLMDVSMPRMDGLEATRRIRSGMAQPGVPVVALTAQAAPERVREFLDAGVDEVITKPATIDALARLIRRVLAESSQAAGAGEGGEEAGADVGADAAEDAGDAVFAQLAADLGPDFLSGMVARFGADGEDALARIAAALAARDLAAAADLAHRLAGSAAALGRTGLHRLLCRQEDAARAGDHRTAAALQPDLRRHLDAALPRMRRLLQAA